MATSRLKHILRFFMVLILVLGLGGIIGSGGGGDDDENSDDNNGASTTGIPDELVGTWKMVLLDHFSSDLGDCESQSFPYSDGEGTQIQIFIKLAQTGTAMKYVQFTNIPAYLNEEGYYDGIYYCTAENKTFTVEDNAITDNTGESSTYSVSGGNLTITLDETTMGCEEVRHFTKAADTVLDSATENCDMAVDKYDDEDNFYEIFNKRKDQDI